MIKEYIEYLKDNPNGYWFKRKLYGWGWTPVKWQGWLVIFLFVAAIFGLALSAKPNYTGAEIAFKFITPLIILVSLLLVVCYKKGEKPGWQWGKK